MLAEASWALVLREFNFVSVTNDQKRIGLNNMNFWS